MADAKRGYEQERRHHGHDTCCDYGRLTVCGACFVADCYDCHVEGCECICRRFPSKLASNSNAYFDRPSWKDGYASGYEQGVKDGSRKVLFDMREAQYGRCEDCEQPLDEDGQCTFSGCPLDLADHAGPAPDVTRPGTGRVVSVRRDDYTLTDEMAAWLHANRDHDEHYWPSDEPCRYCVRWAERIVADSPLAPAPSARDGER